MYSITILISEQCLNKLVNIHRNEKEGNNYTNIQALLQSSRQARKTAESRWRTVEGTYRMFQPRQRQVIGVDPLKVGYLGVIRID